MRNINDCANLITLICKLLGKYCDQIIRTLSDNWEKGIICSNYCIIYIRKFIFENQIIFNSDYKTGCWSIEFSEGRIRYVYYNFVCTFLHYFRTFLAYTSWDVQLLCKSFIHYLLYNGNLYGKKEVLGWKRLKYARLLYVKATLCLRIIFGRLDIRFSRCFFIGSLSCARTVYADDISHCLKNVHTVRWEFRIFQSAPTHSDCHLIRCIEWVTDAFFLSTIKITINRQVYNVNVNGISVKVNVNETVISLIIFLN